MGLRARCRERFVTKPEEYDEPTCGPGPFSMANADTGVDGAVALAMDLGPAGEILRLQGERAAHLHEPIRQALREGMAEFAAPEGVVAPASTWIVTARAAA